MMIMIKNQRNKQNIEITKELMKRTWETDSSIKTTSMYSIKFLIHFSRNGDRHNTSMYIIIKVENNWKIALPCF